MDLRVALALLVLVAGSALAWAGTAPEAALSPSSAQLHGPGPASVKGMVLTVDHEAGTLVLTDGAQELQVRLTGVVPVAVVEEASVVVTGHLVESEGTLLLDGEELLVGCPSKYAA